MPRQSRIDYPGALHHIMVRGIERRNIFADTVDKQHFLQRLGTILTDTRTICYAYALMSNHFHLLLQTGETSISRVMQCLLTGYAVHFNYRHRRTGKLYQNRFKSVLCDKETYFLDLVRYIHLNPVRVRQIDTLSALARSPWTGHAVIMGKKKSDWLQTEEVLSHFGQTVRAARSAYRQYVQEGLDTPEPTDLSGGGLIRSMGGVWEVLKASRRKRKERADERILGSGAFVEAVLQGAQEQESRTSALIRQGWDYKTVKARVCRLLNIEPAAVQTRSWRSAASRARALLSKWLVDDLGEPGATVAARLGVSPSGMTRLVQRGRAVEEDLGVTLDNVEKVN